MYIWTSDYNFKTHLDQIIWTQVLKYNSQRNRVIVTKHFTVRREWHFTSLYLFYSHCITFHVFTLIHNLLNLMVLMQNIKFKLKNVDTLSELNPTCSSSSQLYLTINTSGTQIDFTHVAFKCTNHILIVCFLYCVHEGDAVQKNQCVYHSLVRQGTCVGWHLVWLCVMVCLGVGCRWAGLNVLAAGWLDLWCLVWWDETRQIKKMWYQ